jgi:hypothetical protein
MMHGNAVSTLLKELALRAGIPDRPVAQPPAEAPLQLRADPLSMQTTSHGA